MAKSLACGACSGGGGGLVRGHRCGTGGGYGDGHGDGVGGHDSGRRYGGVDDRALGRGTPPGGKCRCSNR